MTRMRFILPQILILCSAVAYQSPLFSSRGTQRWRAPSSQGHSHSDVLMTADSQSLSKLPQLLSKFAQQGLATIILAGAIANPLSAMALPQKPPESNAQVLLLEALPPGASASVQSLGAELGKMTSEGSGNIRSVDAKGFKGVRSWELVSRQARAVEGLLGTKEKDILTAVGSGNAAIAQDLISGIKRDINDVDLAVKGQDRAGVVHAQVAALEKVDKLGVFTLRGQAPFSVPSDISAATPRSYGRVYAEITVKSGKTNKESVMRATLDGVNAPLTVGNWVALASKGAFNGTPVTYIDESTVMVGNENKKGDLPLEIRAEGDKSISYEETFDEQGRFKAKPVLPFSAYGTLAMNHPTDNTNGAASQFFMLKFDPLYTPAGLNTLDGAYAVFGYVLENADALDDLVVGDKIVSVKVVDKLELKP